MSSRSSEALGYEQRRELRALVSARRRERVEVVSERGHRALRELLGLEHSDEPVSHHDLCPGGWMRSRWARLDGERA